MTDDAWGETVRDAWSLDWSFLTVNHGSYGAVPKMVQSAQNHWRALMQRQPTRFMDITRPRALRAAADRVATFLGARGQDLVFTDNTTTGCNAVLRSMTLEPEDEVVMLDHGYEAVRKTAKYLAHRQGASVVTAKMPFPQEGDVVEAVMNALTPCTRLVILDQITSPSARILPAKAVVAACHARGVPVLVDGAHVPGHIDLDLTDLDADWYVGNGHKWMMAPTGCAMLWAREDRQADLHPTTISHGFGQGFLAEFDFTGTRDVSAFLAITAAMDFQDALGGAGLRARNVRLAAEAAAWMARRLGTEDTPPTGPHGAMQLVRLPVKGTLTDALALRAHLLDLGTDVPVMVLGEDLWLRISAQAYNTMDDYDQVATRVLGAL